jgi:hypothetical protein
LIPNTVAAIQATRLLAFALAGLSPAERASLRWTHNRTVTSGWRLIFLTVRRFARFSEQVNTAAADYEPNLDLARQTNGTRAVGQTKDLPVRQVL